MKETITCLLVWVALMVVAPVSAQTLHTGDQALMCTEAAPLKLMYVLVVQRDREAFLKYHDQLITDGTCVEVVPGIAMEVMDTVDSSAGVVAVRKRGNPSTIYTLRIFLKD